MDLYKTDTALRDCRSLCCFTTSVSHSVETIFLCCGMKGMSDAIFKCLYFLNDCTLVIGNGLMFLLWAFGVNNRLDKSSWWCWLELKLYFTLNFCSYGHRKAP